MALDLSDRHTVPLVCTGCSRQYERVVIFATRDGAAYALVSLVCHGHPDDAVWLDVTLGSWVEPYADHLSFLCRVTDVGAGVVDGLVASRGDANHYGHRLPRDEALSHPALPDVWVVVDEVVTSVPEAAAVIYPG
jgi:hypothetical protein